LLAHRGVDYFFANAGTDFPSIVEGFAKAQATGGHAPQPITVPHENAAVAMAYGYYLQTGRPQAVMVHVNVGTANAAGGLINASRENIPILMMAGRNPIAEGGRYGARSAFIHWAQDSYDQAAMLREYMKWDYELRHESDVETTIDRALQMAGSTPTGPVYLTLPREALAQEHAAYSFHAESRLPAAPPGIPDPALIDQAAQALATAKAPLIVTSTVGKNPAAVAALEDLAARFALPVIQPMGRFMNIADDHPMNLGFAYGDHLANADVILLVDCDAPWVPDVQAPNSDATVITLAADPTFSHIPIRGFAADIPLQGASDLGMQALAAALDDKVSKNVASRTAIETRRQRLTDQHQAVFDAYRAATSDGAAADGPIDPAWASRIVGEVCGADAIYVSEYPLQRPQLRLSKPGSFFGVPPAGALGWGMGCALGMKLACPDKLVVAALGDGAYIFNNPAACHLIAAANDLPLLTIVFNNEMWGAVRGATMQMIPDGYAARANGPVPLSSLTPSPAFEMFVEANGGAGFKVDTAAELKPALEKACAVVTDEKRQAVVHIRTGFGSRYPNLNAKPGRT